MKVRTLVFFIASLSLFLLSPAYAQRGGGRSGGGVRGGGVIRGGGGGFRGGFRGGYYGRGGYYYGGRYWGPGIYFGWGYPYWGYPYYYYWNYPYYWTYPYYGYNSYYYGYSYPPPAPPATAPPSQNRNPNQNQAAPPQDPPDQDPPPAEFGHGGFFNDPEVRQQLGITAAQAEKIRQQESDFRKTEVRNRADLQIKRLDLNDLLSAEQPDRAAIARKLEEIGAAQVALEKSAIDNFLNIRDALTSDQRQKLQQLMTQRQQPAI